jgi:hypothetical protein
MARRQKAIDLNDNRAVYRSKLLLDQDLAARSVSLARIYRDLGFEQLALVEGWKSVNTDPADYSAHRLLADSYSALPRHQIARQSELLQSQLLQPINITSVQPGVGTLGGKVAVELADNFILEAAGPAAPAFNEFNPLYTRNRLTFQTSGVVGSNDTYGDEVVHSGLWNSFSYSVGQLHYQTDGFRQNNDLRQDLLDGFFQASLSPKFRVQAEVRHTEFERGGLALFADSSVGDLEARREVTFDTMRAGAHYTIDHRSDVIASFVHLEGDESFRRSSFATTFGNSGEAQYLFRAERFSSVAGVGYSSYGFDSSDKGSQPGRISHANGYVYSYFFYPKNITWALGLSLHSVSDNLFGNVEQPNPKPD